MKFFSLISNGQVSIAPGQKIIPEKEFSSLKKSSEILKIVKEEATEFRKEVAIESEILKDKAYQDGFLEGLEKLNDKILFLDKSINNLEEELKSQILSVALTAAKKILGDELKLHPERIADIVMQALKPVTQHHKIKIYVNKEDLSLLDNRREHIKSILDQVKIFSIEERDDVKPGGCLIETETGIINAQLENQFRALESAFEKFKKK
jgi:type III secretion protein L